MQWERRENEPNLWYSRFVAYRNMGTSRSLLGAVSAERKLAQKGAAKSVPQSWYEAAKTWDWKARAEAWDADQRRIADEARGVELHEERKRAGESRREIVKALDNLLRGTIATAQKAKVPLSPTELTRLASAAQKLFEMSRLELGEPTSISEISGRDGQPIETAGKVVVYIPDNHRD